MTKRIAVLTSGGDAPGMNAAIRAVVRKTIHDGNEAFGVYYGFKGLAEGDIHPITAGQVSNLSSRGGTILYSARYPEFANEEGQLKAIENLEKYNIDGLVVIGGDGSYHGAMALAEKGYPTVGLPGTIDNDIAGTDFTIGFDTASNTALDALDKLRDTARSHMRTFVVEVMGRNAGDIALWAGIGSGADQIIIPEVEFSMDDVIAQIDAGRAKGKMHHIIVLAEGVMTGREFADRIDSYPGNYHVRNVTLGHIQRGGAPTAKDRMIATQMGYRAVELLLEGKSNVCLGIKHGEIVSTPFKEALSEDSRVKELNVSLEKLNQDISYWSEEA